MKKQDAVLSKETEALAIAQLQRSADERFETRLGQFEAKEWLDELTASIGVHFYNQALADVQAKIDARLEMIDADIWSLKK
jgi:uncharacterized protein (DUF2164 family)